MKRKALILILLVTLFTSFFSAAIQPHASASAQSDAKKYCEAAFKNSRNPAKNVVEGDCESAYVEARKEKSKPGSTVGRDTLCQSNNIDEAACTLGWNSVLLNLAVTDAPNAQKYIDSCTQYAGNSQVAAACKKGVASAIKGDNSDKVCNTYTDAARSPAKTACKNGFTKAKATISTQQSNSQSSSSNSTAPSSSQNEKTLGCDSSDNKLGWIICPIVEGVAKVVETLDNLITATLEVNTDQIFCDNQPSCKAYQAAWSNFRNIAIGLLVLIGMVILISQALGMEILDAYTIRKTLPRFLIAIILISLSWPLMEFALRLSNALGFGIRFLIYAPFNNIDPTIDLTFGTSIVATFFTAGALTLLGIFGLLSYALTALLAVFVAILVLVLRQIVIIVFVVLAPVAIVLYILPNTNRVFRFWLNTFVKILLMFPIIAGAIAAGRVFAAITLQSGSAGTFNNFIAFIAYFAPYFLIPFVFNFVGGAIGQISGMINNSTKGLSGGLQSFRGNKVKQNAHALKTGDRFEGKRWLPGSIKASEMFNETTKGIGTGWRGRYGVTARGKEARAIVGMTAAEQAGQTEGMKAIAGYNDANRILAAGMGDIRRGRRNLINHLRSGGDDGATFLSQEEAEKRADLAEAAANAAGGFTEANARAAFMNMARDGTALRDVDDMAHLAATVGGGNRNATFSYAANAASISRQVGRPGLAAASEPIGALAFAYSDQIHHNGLGNSGDINRLSHEAWQSGAGGEIMYTKMGNAKARDIRNDLRKASEVLQYHQDLRSGKIKLEEGQEPVYSETDVRDAATVLVETQGAVDQGIGKQNNRSLAKEELAKSQDALDFYLDSQTNPDTVTNDTVTMDVDPATGDAIRASDTVPKIRTNRDVVREIVGKRVSSLSEDEMARLRTANKTPEEEG